MGRSVFTVTEVADAMIVLDSDTHSPDVTWNAIDEPNGDMFRTHGNELMLFRWDELTRNGNVTLTPRFSYENRGVERFSGISGDGPGTIIPAVGEVLLLEGASSPPHYYIIGSISTFLFAGIRQVAWPNYIYLDYDLNDADRIDLTIAIIRPKGGV